MIIGDRLRAIREQKKLSQGGIGSVPDSSDATSVVAKTAIPYPRSKR